MSEYLIIDNPAERSRLEAMQRGAGLQSEAVTEFWHGWIMHPVTGQTALVVTDEADKEFFSVAELAALLTEEQATNDDWFVNFEEAI